ncbi:leucine-rich repeat receptor protein kinase HPCA1 isoform X2 [Physcomitrium patens]|uniref:Protein kinase domain-containing protein n=1 Tax=Physcomitrium patens TaxID=3218 RepID=A0A7I4F575_PHYPA|nr:putative serine/threonine-protein kinase isoform X2 [Physcomitrium patens]|eukprot:XP_024395939.1 putative serine/threonine-protein kinase isoform X2 [Physcomitrella patens]
MDEHDDPNPKRGPRGLPITTYTYTYKELKSGTQNFDTECRVHYGELGLLYKAYLSPSEVVAVKRATRESQQSPSDFRNEIKFLSGLHNKYILNLCGFCEEKGEQILVYESITNGSLADHFLGESGLSLTWRERVRIAICVAKGLTYLHEECYPPVVHKGVKPTNILLDHNFHAKIANFGPNATHMLMGALGTPGYVDPSYVSNAGPACDIYSFGVVLLQLVTGKRACDSLRDEAAYYITDWVRFKLESGDFDETLDINLRSTAYNPEILLQMARLGLRCTDLDPKKRLSMSQVVQELEHALQVVDVLLSNAPTALTAQVCDGGSGYTCRSSGSDFSLPELGGKDAHIKFDGMEWIDIKALEVPDLSDVFEDLPLETVVT